jgi:hypothetical protein
MEIRIRETGAVVMEQEFRALHPNTSMPQPLTEATINSFGGDVVFNGPQAQPTRYQVAFRDGVEQIDGKWYSKFSVSDMDAEGIAATDSAQAAAVRSDRNAKLSASDWVVSKAVEQNAQDSLGIQIPVVWLTYRQALRDITAQAGFPWTIDWPVAP